MSKKHVSKIWFEDLTTRRITADEKNLRISGLAESSSETWKQTSALASTILQDKLQLPSITTERANGVGPASSSQNRTIVKIFDKIGDRQAVLINSRKLKGTGIYNDEDLCPALPEM